MGKISAQAMLIAFYVAVLLQLAAGGYSLWRGFEWLGAVRRRLISHSGFYAPAAAVICPCKGLEPGLEENLLALTRFEYASYEIYISLATSLDPALKIIERVKAASRVPVHIVIAGAPQDCGEKVHNLRRAIEQLPETLEVLVFTDSDARPGRGWLSRLVAPLQDPRIGATTTYRWILPTRATAAAPNRQPANQSASNLAGGLACAWNAAIVTMQGGADTFCWGGGTAIRRTTFAEVGVLEDWKSAVSDDWTMTAALGRTGKSIVFCAECLAPTLHPWSFESLLDFTNRQILITRVYAPPRWWRAGILAHVSYAGTLIYAAVVILSAMISGDPWAQLLLPVLAILLLATLKGVLRTVAVGELLPEYRAALAEWSWTLWALAPAVPFLFAWNFLATLFTRRLRWRGVRYELISPTCTRVLKR